MKYIAHFQPQVYITGDQAVDAEAKGPTEWDATPFIEANPELKDEIDGELEDTDSWEDLSDKLAEDPNIPNWASRWLHKHPFVITVRKAKDDEEIDTDDDDNPNDDPKYCDNSFCEFEAVEASAVSYQAPHDGEQHLCAGCGESYTVGVQHGRFHEAARYGLKPGDDDSQTKPTAKDVRLNRQTFLDTCTTEELTEALRRQQA
jgi:hypothetical protein